MTRPAAAPPSLALGSVLPTEHSEARRLLDGLIALAADAIVSADDTHNIVIFNPAAERIFGYGRDEVIGQPLDILLPESARSAHHAQLEQFRESTAESRQMSHREPIWGRRKSGELFPA